MCRNLPPPRSLEDHVEEPEEIGAPAASLLPPDEPLEPEPELPPEVETASLLPPPPVTALRTAPSADVIDLASRVRRWRGLAIVAGALAAGLVALIVVSQAQTRFVSGGRLSYAAASRTGPRAD